KGLGSNRDRNRLPLSGASPRLSPTRARPPGRAPTDKSGAPLIPQAGIQERAQAVAAAGVAQFAQSLGLDLADALARHREMLADLFERMLAAVLQAEAHLNDLLLARAQRLEHLRGLLAQV